MTHQKTSLVSTYTSLERVPCSAVRTRDVSSLHSNFLLFNVTSKACEIIYSIKQQFPVKKKAGSEEVQIYIRDLFIERVLIFVPHISFISMAK